MWWQPPNVQKIWPERTEKLRSSRWNFTFCDLDGRKLLNQLTLGCGKVRRAWSVWVCKCLQLIYRGALPLTFSTSILDSMQKLFQSNKSVLALWLSASGSNFCWRYHYDLQESITSDGVGVWVLLRTNWLAMFKAWEPKAKLLRSSWNWNLGKPNLSYSGIPLCKICRTALTIGWSNLTWWQTSLLGQRGSFSCRTDTAFAYHIAVYHWQPVIQYNVGQT